MESSLSTCKWPLRIDIYRMTTLWEQATADKLSVRSYPIPKAAIYRPEHRWHGVPKVAHGASPQKNVLLFVASSFLPPLRRVMNWPLRRNGAFFARLVAARQGYWGTKGFHSPMYVCILKVQWLGRGSQVSPMCTLQLTHLVIHSCKSWPTYPRDEKEEEPSGYKDPLSLETVDQRFAA